MGGRVQIANFGKNTSSSFDYYMRITKHQPPILRNLGNFPLAAFYLTYPLQLGTKEYGNEKRDSSAENNVSSISKLKEHKRFKQP